MRVNNLSFKDAYYMARQGYKIGREIDHNKAVWYIFDIGKGTLYCGGLGMNGLSPVETIAIEAAIATDWEIRED